MGMSNPDVYLSEQARLEAQRRMLVERYGLYSDSDDSDGDEKPTISAASGSSANGNPNHSSPASPSTSASTGAVAPDTGSAIKISTSSSTLPAESTNQSSPKKSGVPTSANTSHRGSQSADASPSPVKNSDALELIIDTAHGHKIRAFYDHTASRAGKQPSVLRDVRITSLTTYASQLIESHNRKIAVNGGLVCYGVGGHVRVMIRQSPARCLLKGHNSVVSDIEFLSFHETKLESSPSYISILGSVADDGSVYVWKLIRSGEHENADIEIADVIRFEHPDFDKGRCYKRVAFRPGPNFIIAENGIGVAMLLLDTEDTDLRVVELVKMNDKMMVRDKFLVAKNEVVVEGDPPLGPIEAAAWLSESMMVTSRGGHVFLWNIDNTHSSCIARVPREKNTPVTSIICLEPDVLLFVVAHGRELEVWLKKDTAGDSMSLTMQLQQKIRLFDSSTNRDVRCTVSMDPSQKLLTVSNMRSSSFFVLHFNFQGRAFDSITEVAVKDSIFSYCIAPTQKSSGGVKSTVFSGASGDEIGVWCVHQHGMQVVHIPSEFCIPRGTITPDVHPKPAPRTVRRKDKKHGLLTQSPPPSIGSSSTSSTTDGTLETSKRVVKSVSLVKGATDGNGSGTTSLDIRNVGSMASTKSGPTSSTGPQKKNSTENLRGKMGSPSSASFSEDGSKSGGQSSDVSGKKGGGGPSDASRGEEMADAILSAAKKVIAAFDDVSAQRSANERVKVEKLVETVTETAVSNMERFVNSAMKKVLADMLVPSVSEMIADCRAAMTERARIDGQVGHDHFEEVFERAALESSFSNACKEMERQVSSAVTESLVAKYETFIRPSMEVVNDAAADLSSSVGLLKDELVKFKPEGSDVKVEVSEVKVEDVRQVIEDQLRDDNVDDAFLTALNKEDLGLVTWLCSKFDPSQFFLENPLSQVCMMSLAQQLGQGLTEGDDIVWKVDWLKEVVLALEPESEDIQSISMLEVRELLDKVKELRKDSELMEQHPGLERDLKTLSRLVSSHLTGDS